MMNYDERAISYIRKSQKGDSAYGFLKYAVFFFMACFILSLFLKFL